MALPLLPCGKVRYLSHRLRSSAGYTMIEITIVAGIIGVVGAIALPFFDKTVESFRIVGTARSVTNALSVSKIRAASTFTRVRLYVDLSSHRHRMERLDKSVTPAHWTPDGSWTSLPSAVTFGFGSITTPPAETQPALDQAPACTDDADAAIGNTACVMFNSRGVPIKLDGTPENRDALYVTDGTAIYGVTVAPTGMIRLWRTYPRETAEWVLQ